MVLAISFLTLAVEQVAVEIEQPFGNGNNGLPMQTYVRQIEADLTGLLDAHDGLHTKSSAVARPPLPHEKQAYLQTNRTSNTFQSDVETDIQTDDGEQSSISTPPHGHAHGHVNEEMREFVEA